MEPENDNAQTLNPRLVLIGVGVLVLLLILIIVLVVSSRKKTTSPEQPSQTSSQNNGFFGLGGNKGTTTSSTSTSRPTPIFSSTADMAGVVLAWINTQKDQKGKYYFGQVCTQKNTCNSPTDNPNGLAVLWARYLYYKKIPTNDNLALLKKDIATYSNKDVVGPIQNGSWNCKLMYPLAQDSLFNQTEKDLIKNICVTSIYYVPNEINKANVTAKDIPISDLPQLISSLIASPYQNGANSASSGTDTSLFENYIIAASDYTYIHKWSHDVLSIPTSELYLKKALQEYVKNRPTLSEASSKIGIAALDIFQETNDNNYLSLAYYIFKQNSSFVCSSLEGCYSFAMLSSQLFDTVHENKYKTFKQSTMQILLDNNFDYKGFKGFSLGKNAFYKGVNNLVYPVKDNAIILGLLVTL